MIGLAGKTVLVTGASRGLGQAIAAAFAAAGAGVHVLAEDDGVVGAAKALAATPHIADITDPKAVSQVIDAIGPLDVLVNNAGLERLTPIEDDSDEALATFRRIIDINLTGTAIVTGRAQRAMAAGAVIINTASIWGRVAEPLFGAYVASKHALIGLTKTWARELGPRGIRVNAVCPGWVRTESSIRSARSLAVRRGQPEGAIIDEVAAAQALPGGLMEPPDVVGPYLFLASDHAANITGQTLGIDRGEVPW